MHRPPALDTNTHKNASTSLGKGELEALDKKVKDASREKLGEILKGLDESLLNTYYKREINQLEGMLDNEKFKLDEIRSTIRGLLMKLVPREE